MNFFKDLKMGVTWLFQRIQEITSYYWNDLVNAVLRRFTTIRFVFFAVLFLVIGYVLALI